MNMKLAVLTVLASLGVVFQGCRTDFEVYAPEKEIRAVYCVLNPNDSVQYVRIARAFQVEGDAIVFAAENDLSLSGLTVTMSGNGHTWTAQEMPNFPKDSGGVFFPGQTIYKFTTDDGGPGREALEATHVYRIEVGTADTPDYTWGETVVPEPPDIRGATQLTAGQGATCCLPRLALEDAYVLSWKRLSPEYSYEVRVGLEFEKNGVPQQALWGPSNLESDNRSCNDGAGRVCRKFQEKELLTFFKSHMPEDGSTYTYDTEDSCQINPTPTIGCSGNIEMYEILPQSLWFEVTAVDEYLGNYMNVNDPQFVDLTGARPEYTNLSGNIDVIGVIGSINIDRKYAILRPCSQALLGLNGTALPNNCSW